MRGNISEIEFSLQAMCLYRRSLITAVARQLVTIANALCESRQNWTTTTT